MSINNNCGYCAKDQNLSEIMIEICELEVSTLYLFKEQTYRGRCIVAYKDHGVELFELQEKDMAALMNDVTKAAKAINKSFTPDKINYGVYADKNPHLHFHIVPKYKDGYSWGGTFEMMPQNKTLLSDEEYTDIINVIKSNL